MKKKIMLFILSISLVSLLVSCSNDDAEENVEDDVEQSVEGYLATFILDEHVTVTVYDTSEYVDGVVTNTAYAKDSDTGEILTDGSGQINFVISVDEGYEIDSVVVVSEDNYKNLKDPEELELDDTYRITKITGDLTITITTSSSN